MTAFKKGDRFVALSGWTGTVQTDDGGNLVTVILDINGGLGNVERQYLSPLKPGVIPHRQDASNAFH
ncbi:hypothetical protein [Mesorhizobium sp. Cs1299R1N3]|uniref:hypothetical protein n=1 Tax=Mesorhizobium sp. Cs1299R1N3 TaxID=3015173 RepID=UPI00301D80E8